MKSPFPGMDPYLERYWGDVHTGLCMYSRDLLQPQVRPALLARAEERVVVETPETARRIVPDVSIVELPWNDADIDGGSVLEVVAPVKVQLDPETYTETFIQITDPSNNGRLITVIEFLLISNKTPGEGQQQYRQKQKELKQAGVSLVEVDLLRSGDWVIQAPAAHLAKEHRLHAYRVCVHRGWMPHECEFYGISLRHILPQVKIPLREKDADAVLDLQAVIETIYANGAYETIDYTRPLDPPLTGAAAAWAQERIRRPRKVR